MTGTCTWDLRLRLNAFVLSQWVSWGGDEDASPRLSHTPGSHHDMMGGQETEEPLKHLPQSDTPALTFFWHHPPTLILRQPPLHWPLLDSTVPCLPPTLPARIKRLICCHAKNSSSHRIKAATKWQCVALYPHRREGQQPVYCIFTPWKFHVSLIDLVSQLASQLQLTPSTTYNWQRLAPPPYAALACILPIARVNMHEASAYVWPLLMVSMHVLRVRIFNAAGGARLDRELIPPQRQLSHSERQKAGTSTGRERQAERRREREMILTPGNRCPINISP